jgi:trypsin
MMASRSRIASLLLCFQILATQVTGDSTLKLSGRGKDDFQIVGGSPANTDIFGAYVAFANYECGGVLISKNRVLTSAHCVQSGHPDTVRVGAVNRTSGVEVGVRCAKSHPLYVWPGFQYDIAVLKLEQDVTSVETPTLNVDLDYPRQPGQQLLLAGMGRNFTSGYYSETLEEVRYSFVSEDECKITYDTKITRGLHVCALGRNKGGKSEQHSPGCTLILYSTNLDCSLLW